MASNVASGKYSLYNEQFPKSLQQGFQELRESVCLCDIQLVAEDRRFWAHRSVLAAASPYFRVMFSSDMRERTMEAVELKAIPAIGLECALDFIYTSLLNADFDSMEDVLLASTHLQVADLTDCCARILKEWLRVDNVFEILSLSERYDLPALKSHCIAFISQNLRAVLRTRENSLLQIDWECFSGLLRRDDVNPLVSESDILELAINWLNHDREGREQWLEPLVREIRLGLIFPSDVDYDSEGHLCSSAQLLRESVPRGDAYLRTLRRGDARFETDVSFHNWFKIRSTRKGVLATCGKTTGSLECGEIMVLTGKSMDSWDTISRRKGMYNHCTVVLDDFLYLIGGQNSWFSDNHEEEAVASVWRFDPRFHRWTKMADMNVRRRRFHCSVLGGGVYAVGGRGEGGLLFSAERYSPAHNRWTHIRALPRPLSSHAGAVYQDQLYVCGGSSGEVFSDALFCYAPDRDEWTRLAPLRHARGFHSMSTVHHHIYVIGGVVIGGGGGRGGRSYSDLLVTECYSPRDDQWTELRPLPAGHSQHGATAVGQTIYILGGFSWTAEGFLSAVHLYDTQSDTWAAGPPLPRPLVGLSSATLTLPHRVCPAHDDDVAAQPVE
ncbi:kelch-like protein 9 [Conger conger]|uniref:kelch-like protein 9 n=1 Tax=Conger conger TaxID=82655 RepID=UPI002A5A57EA|nr:kelch-like protein 9 [Conger conger]